MSKLGNILKPQEVNVPASLRTGDKAFDALQDEFILFCRSRSGFHTDASFAEQFLSISALPGIAHVGFAKKELFQHKTLVLGTEPVKLLNNEDGKRYLIGQFLICIRKSQPSTFYFKNIDGEKKRIHNGTEILYQHPHINSAGEMCMMEGRPEILDAIGSGDLLTAVTMILAALHSYNPGYAYANVGFLWPAVEDHHES